MALRAVIDHPKFARLKVLLKMNKACTLGYLEGLWHFCGRYTPQGNIGKYTDEDIEAWLEWGGEEGALIDAMVKARWVDRSDQHRLIVHDWHNHADDATRMALKRSKLDFATRRDDSVGSNDDKTPTCPDGVATVSGLPGAGAVPGAEPEESTSGEVDCADAPKKTKRESSPRFVKPTPEEVADYFREQGSTGAEAKRFWDRNEAVEWKVGNSPMKNWRAAIRYWLSNSNSQTRGPTRDRRAIGTTLQDMTNEAMGAIYGTG